MQEPVIATPDVHRFVIGQTVRGQAAVEFSRRPTVAILSSSAELRQRRLTLRLAPLHAPIALSMSTLSEQRRGVTLTISHPGTNDQNLGTQ